MILINCEPEVKIDPSVPSLKQAYKDYFMIGTALNAHQLKGKEQNSVMLVEKHYNTITAENVQKWEIIHPEADRYDFEYSDTFVDFGVKNNMFIIGHTLVWHNQTPDWVFEDDAGNPVDKETLLVRMRDHIFTVVGRYKGKVHGWDVINESFDDKGAYRHTKWYNIIGPEYIEKAFQWAHEADPNAELHYNDYNMWYPGRRDAVLNLVEDLKSKNIPIHGIGLQGHWGMDYPPMDTLEMALAAYAETGLNLMLSEVDINLLPLPEDNTGADIDQTFELRKEFNPYEEGLPDSMETVLSEIYQEVFKLTLKYKENITRVTFWGVHDGVSWLNNWPVRGRTNYPLLFDRNYQPKRAFHGIIELISN
jgi:endo-1,4-beta-xylanase